MAVRKSSKKPQWQTQIAKERMDKLLRLGKISDSEKSKRYLELAFKIGMRYNIRIPKEEKRRICKKCLSFLIPEKTSVIRVNPKQQAVIITCKNCGSIKRFPYRKERN